MARAEGYGIDERLWVPDSLRTGSLWVPEIALTERHADLVELLVRHPLGLDAQALMGALAGATTPVTVRAEMSRLRRRLGGLLGSRPYRLTVPATVRD